MEVGWIVSRSTQVHGLMEGNSKTGGGGQFRWGVLGQPDETSLLPNSPGQVSGGSASHPSENLGSSGQTLVTLPSGPLEILVGRSS